MRERGRARVVVERGEHAHVMAQRIQLAAERLDVAHDPSGVRPRIWADERDAHKGNPKRADRRFRFGLPNP